MEQQQPDGAGVWEEFILILRSGQGLGLAVLVRFIDSVPV